jgi:hypothetical protein
MADQPIVTARNFLEQVNTDRQRNTLHRGMPVCVFNHELPCLLCCSVIFMSGVIQLANPLS